MSRIGRKPVEMPAGVKAEVSGNGVKVGRPGAGVVASVRQQVASTPKPALIVDGPGFGSLQVRLGAIHPNEAVLGFPIELDLMERGLLLGGLDDGFGERRIRVEGNRHVIDEFPELVRHAGQEEAVRRDGIAWGDP